MKPIYIRWYPVLWLHSTARDEMGPAERATFHDFVCLAGVSKVYGKFKFSSIEGLARSLNTPKEIIESTIKICLDRYRIKMREVPEGFEVTIIKWKQYQALREDGNVNIKDDNDGFKVNSKRHFHSNTISSSLHLDLSSWEWKNIKEEDRAKWKQAFPACDIELELLQMAEWVKANPTKKKSNWRRFIINWLTRRQDQGGTKKGKGEWIKEWAK